MSVRAAKRAAKRRQPDVLADVLIALTEKERRSLYEDLMELTRAAPHPQPRDPDTDRCFFIALWGTGTSRDVRNAIASWRFTPDPRVAEVVAVRPRKTIDALANGALKDDWARGPWFVLRDLIRTGVVDHPQSDAYYAALVRAMPLRSLAVATGKVPEDQLSSAIVAELRADPELPGELLRALEIEEAVNTLTGLYLADPWLLTFERLIAEGIYERDAVLDLALEGQLRDLRKSAATFFRKLFDRLEPRPAELAARSDTLIRILASSNPAEQAAAAKALIAIAGSGSSLDLGAIGSAVITPLTGTQKAAAMAALRLLGSCAMPIDQQAAAAVHGLGHPHADVQERSLRLIEQCGDAVPQDVRAEAMVWLDVVTPALRDRLVEVAGVESISAEAGSRLADLGERRGAGDSLPGTNAGELWAAIDRGEMPGPLRFDPFERPPAGDPVAPIEDPGDLVASITALLGGAGGPVDLERVIDAFARIGPASVDHTIRSPIRAAAENTENPSVLSHWHGWGVKGHLAVAAMCWTAERPPPPLPYLVPARTRLLRRSPAQLSHDVVRPQPDAARQWWAAAFDGSSYTAGLAGFVAARLWEAVTAGVTRPRPTLALPTTSDGWLSAEELRRRLAANRSHGVVPSRFDAVQALLRLHPAHGEVSPAIFHDGTSGPTDTALVRAAAVQARPVGVELPTFRVCSTNRRSRSCATASTAMSTISGATTPSVSSSQSCSRPRTDRSPTSDGPMPAPRCRRPTGSWSSGRRSACLGTAVSSRHGRRPCWPKIPTPTGPPTACTRSSPPGPSRMSPSISAPMPSWRSASQTATPSPARPQATCSMIRRRMVGSIRRSWAACWPSSATVAS